ncbi:MAG: DUF3592 domain-containing protein [Candidatus Rokuibacteriota bacterium]
MRRRPKSFFGLAKRSFAFWFGGIWLVCGAPFLIVGVYVGIDTIRQQQQFQKEAQVTQGMVLTKRISRSKDSTSYWVGYRFNAPDGGVVKTEVKVSGEFWDRLVEREPLQVTYLPSDPQNNRIEGAGPDWMLPGIFLILGIVLVPLGGWIFFKGVSGILRELRLQTGGAMAEATVVEVGPADVSFNGVPQWRIRYRYLDHRGRTRSGESGLTAPQEAQEWKVGDKGVARFDTRAPKKSVWIGKA